MLLTYAMDIGIGLSSNAFNSKLIKKNIQIPQNELQEKQILALAHFLNLIMTGV